MKASSTKHSDVVIYHADCLDGFCAAWVANHAMPDARFIPAKYGDPLPNVKLGDRVYILDFSYPREKLLLLATMCAYVTVLDHHKTAQEDLGTISPDVDWPENIEIIFDLERSGARLAYDYFLPEENGFRPCGYIEWLVNAVQDRDLWRFKIPGSEEICLALGAVERNFDQWDLMASSRIDAVQAGAYIKNYRDQQVQQIIKGKVRWTEIGGHIVPTVCAPVMQSEVGHELLKLWVAAPFAASYYIDERGREIFSLRSQDHREDVSAIAKKYGGGGHRNAAGFTRSFATDLNRG